jgi:hypothetical protein
MKITKELLINLIKEEIEARNVRELDVIPGNTQHSHMIDDNHKLIMSKFKNTTTNKVNFYVAIVEGTGKDESLTKMRKVFDNREHAENFFEKYKNSSLKQLKHIFDNKKDKKEGEHESQSST